MQNPKVKTVSSTATVTFRNTSGSYYDMIISVQNQTIDQSINITDTQGNLITENPIVLTVPAKVILKDVQVGTITFSDSNSYSIIISYLVKESASGIPYIDVDYQNGYIYTQEVGTPQLIKATTNTIYTVSPPAGKKWLLRSISLGWTAAATQNDYPVIEIVPNNEPNALNTDLNLFYGTIAVTAGDDYLVDVARYVQTRSAVNIGQTNVTEQTVYGGFEVYPTEYINIPVNGESATIYIYISYIEVNLG